MRTWNHTHLAQNCAWSKNAHASRRRALHVRLLTKPRASRYAREQRQICLEQSTHFNNCLRREPQTNADFVEHARSSFTDDERAARSNGPARSIVRPRRRRRHDSGSDRQTHVDATTRARRRARGSSPSLTSRPLLSPLPALEALGSMRLTNIEHARRDRTRTNARHTRPLELPERVAWPIESRPACAKFRAF